jgi:DegV family protein with EDD domain
MRIRVTVDSTNDLSPELIARYDISVVPLTVNLGGRAHKDLVDITPEDIYRHVDAGGDLPKTSAVNAEEYRAFFEGRLRDCDAIVHINISGEMSVCHQNALIAAEGLPVYPVDSRNLSTGSALLALRACELAREGADAARVASTLSGQAELVDASFLVSRLDYLHKGGRCSAIAALGANILRLRPCIEVRGGKMGVGRKYRGPFIRCLEQYVRDRLEGASDIDLSRIFITHSGVPDETLEAVRAAIKQCQTFGEVLVTRAGCTISSHCGEGTLGVLYMHR